MRALQIEIARLDAKKEGFHPGGDPRAPTARWHKWKGEWVLLASPLWKLRPEDEVSVPVRGTGKRRLIFLGEFVGNTGPALVSWRDCKDAFRPTK